MRIKKCYFCSSSIYPGHGISFVRNDCKTFNFCRSKCHKAFKKRKNPRKVGWTKAFRKCRGKELTIDPSFNFETRKNAAVKYNRETMSTVIDCMKKTTEIRNRRESQYILDRLKVGDKIDKAKAVREVQQNLSLLRSPASKLPLPNCVAKIEEMTQTDKNLMKKMLRTSELSAAQTNVKIKSSKKKSKEIPMEEELQERAEIMEM